MSCPLCDDPRRPRQELRAHGADLVRCRRCGLVRVDPMPARDKAVALYSDAYFRDPERGYVDYVADEPVFRREFKKRLHVVRAAGGHGALLDAGCASGALLVLARAMGFRPTGIEPAEGMARRAAEQSGCPVLAAPLHAALLAPASFDVVTLFDVLEHLADPKPALRRLRLSLSSGGLIAVTVPNYGGLWARASGRRWPFITPWEHLLYFTRRTLRAILHETGFSNVRFHAACTPVSLATVAARTLLPRRILPSGLAHRGFGLPAGTLFALADVP